MARFQYGVCEWSMKARGRELVRIAAAQKLDCLQLGVGEEIFNGDGLGSGVLIAEYLYASRQYGVKICSLSPQFVDQYSFTMPQNDEEAQVAVTLVEQTIKLCGKFGCRNYLLPVLGKNGIVDGPSFHRAVEYIKRFGDQAAKQGIETYLELNLSTEKVLDLLDAVNNPMVKIFFDSQNLYAHDGTSMARYFTELELMIAGVHLKDGAGTMLSGSLLGEGTSGFFQTAEAIKRSSYTGPLFIESVYAKPSVYGLGTEEELLGKDAALLHKVFDNV